MTNPLDKSEHGRRDASASASGDALRHQPLWLTPREVVRVQLDEFLRPGGAAFAYLLTPDRSVAPGDALDDDDSGLSFTSRKVTVSDINVENYGLPGEWIDVFWRRDLQVFQPVGSSGLVRRVKTREAITNGQSGQASIYYNNKVGDVVEFATPITVTTKWLVTLTSPEVPEGTEAVAVFIADRDPDSLSVDTGEWILITVDSITNHRLGIVNTSSGFLDHNQSDNVDFVESATIGSCGDFDTPGTDSTIACNALRQRLWNGSIVGLVRITTSGTSTAPVDANDLTPEQANNLTPAQANVMKPDVEASSERWYIVEAYSAKNLRGKLASDLNEEDATVLVDYLVPLDGHFPIPSASTAIVATNLFDQSGSFGDDVVLKWDDTTNVWLLMPFGAGGAGGPDLFYGTADANIDYNTTGSVTITDFDPSQQVEARNVMCTRVWSGAPVVVARMKQISESEPTSKSEWRIIAAYTARKIKGNLKTNLLPTDPSGTLKTVLSIDGHYSPADADNVNVDNWIREFGCTDSPAFAKWDERTKTWQLETVARPTDVWASATAAVEYCGGTQEPTYDVDGLTGFGYGCIPESSNLTIANPHKLPMQIGDSLDLVVDLSTLNARIVQVHHKLSTFVTEVRYDATNHRFMKKEMQVSVPSCQNETEQQIIALGLVSAVNGIGWGTPHILASRTLFYAFEARPGTIAEVDFFKCDGSQE